MNIVEFDEAIEPFSQAIAARMLSDGPKAAKEIYEASGPIFVWLNYLANSELTGKSDDFLDGLRASIVETIGLSIVGFGRPALFSLRTQIDIVLSWLYFKDHPVEWSRVADTGKSFMLKSAIFDYLNEFQPRFKKRFETLLSKKKRKNDDPYKLLSAHVHAQGVSVLPIHSSLTNIVQPIEIINELAIIQAEVSEYISDVLVSCFGNKWAALPDSINKDVRSRLKQSEIAEVFS